MSTGNVPGKRDTPPRSLHVGVANCRGKAEIYSFLAVIIRNWMFRISSLPRGILHIHAANAAWGFSVPGRKVQNVHESMTRFLSVDCAIGGYLRASLSSGKTSRPRETVGR